MQDIAKPFQKTTVKALRKNYRNMQPNDPNQLAPEPNQQPHNLAPQSWSPQDPTNQQPIQQMSDPNTSFAQQPDPQTPLNQPSPAQQPGQYNQPLPTQPQTVFPGNQAVPTAQPMGIQATPAGYPASAVAAMGEGDKSFIGTFLLSWLLGSFGADRFYVGKIGTAIFKLLTLGGLGIWQLVDMILIGFGKFKDKEGRQLQGYEQNKGWARIVALFLLIVNVFVGGIILFALVIISFIGVQNKAADSERQTDINAIFSGLEGYYTLQNQYPTLDQMNDPTWREANLKSVDQIAFTTPNNSQTDTFGTAPEQYHYAPSGENGAECDGQKVKCTSYSLTAELEGGGSYAKTSMN